MGTGKGGTSGADHATSATAHGSEREPGSSGSSGYDWSELRDPGKSASQPKETFFKRKIWGSVIEVGKKARGVIFAFRDFVREQAARTAAKNNDRMP